MDDLVPGDFSNHITNRGNSYEHSQEKLEDGARWYFTRKEIEENSPSQWDGIDLKKETYLRKSYCTFLQDLGMRLKVPQVTIATAIIFCHRFFLRQSHAKNDRRTIATVCMFLAGKVEETPRPLKDVILVSYEIINKNDPTAVRRIKQKEVYEQQKELVLLGEKVVLGTLAFDLNLHHSYKPLVEAIKKFKVAQIALAQVAWNFVNDGLRTSLCLQFEPHHIAAGAIFLAAKFLKVKLPSDSEKVWWQEFDVTPRQLEEVSNQMLELYEQSRLRTSNDAEGSQRSSSKVLSCNDEMATTKSQSGDVSIKRESRGLSSMPVPDCDFGGNKEPERGVVQNTIETTGVPSEQSGSRKSRVTKSESLEVDEKARHSGENQDHKEGSLYRPPPALIKKVDRDKVKAALEKYKKTSPHIKSESMDEDDLIERELEAGIELAAESERNKQDQQQSWSTSSEKLDYENSYPSRREDHEGTKKNQLLKGQSSRVPDFGIVEEGEVAVSDDLELGKQLSKSINRKRQATSSPEKALDGSQRNSFAPGYQDCHRLDYMVNGNKVGRLEYTERDNKRHVQENHV